MNGAKPFFADKNKLTLDAWVQDLGLASATFTFLKAVKIPIDNLRVSALHSSSGQ